MTQIEVKHLSRKFQQTVKQPGFWGNVKSLFKPVKRDIVAVNDISFSIEEGELVGFIGPNGAGKTTTLKMLTGIIHPSSGLVRVMGYTPYERKKDYLKKISLIMGQKSQLWSDLSPMDMYILYKDIYDIDKKIFTEKVGMLSELLDVKHVINVQTRKLSLGERMKCEVIAVLLHDPKIVFLDEPTIGMDILSQKKMREFLVDYNREKKATIILTSHNMDDVQEVCDRLVIINKGGLIYDGGINEINKRFIGEKYIDIELNKEVENGDLEKYGRIINKHGLKITLAVNKQDHTKIAARLLQEYEVDNLDINEPELEDIISRIYREKNTP